MNERGERLCAELATLTTVTERLQAVLDEIPAVDRLRGEQWTGERRVDACATPVYVDVDVVDDLLALRVGCAGLMVGSLAALVCAAFDGLPPVDASSARDPLSEFGLDRGLTATRRRGLAAVRAHILSRAMRLAPEAVDR